LMAIILQRFIFDAWNVAFAVTIIICLTLIWVYTHKGGLKTIIITDLLQTFFLLFSVVLSIYFIAQSLNMNFVETFDAIKESTYSKIFFWDNFMGEDRKSTRLNSSHVKISYAVFCLKKKK